MDPRTADAIDRCSTASKEGRIRFGDVVAALAGAGVESYWADYRGAVTTYYLDTGDVHATQFDQPGVPIAEAFDVAGVQDAIRGTQRDEMRYPEFVRRTRAAGCVGYVVWLAGRHVTYFGRRGEMHLERFPD